MVLGLVIPFDVDLADLVGTAFGDIEDDADPAVTGIIEARNDTGLRVTAGSRTGR